MSWTGWLLSLLAGVACAGVWWKLRALLRPRRLRYVRPYRPASGRDAPRER